MINKLLAISIACLSIMFVAASPLSAKMPSEDSYTNFIGMKFVCIEPGSFEMGNLTELLPFDMMPRDGGPGNRMDHLRVGDFDERPVHSVTITKPFYMATLEVSNFQYELFDASHKKSRGKDKISTDDDEAVVNVNWYEAQSFCKWPSKKDGMSYRLPTEA